LRLNGFSVAVFHEELCSADDQGQQRQYREVREKDGDYVWWWWWRMRMRMRMRMGRGLPCT
jgi:hypothetical protein